MKNNNPINVYFTSDHDTYLTENWDFLYPKPKTLFSNLIEERKNPKNKQSFFLCPAVAPKFKKTLVFNSPMNCSYEYDHDQDGYYMNATKIPYINMSCRREEALKDKPTFSASLSYLFFADDSLDLFFTPPYFHEPKYTKYGACMPGEFNIGKWFRPFNFEFQTWSKRGEFHLEENEPLFYAEFKTDRQIFFHRFNLTPGVQMLAKSNVNSIQVFGPFQTLAEKYAKFKQVGLREKILTEIKKNLIDEEPYKF